MSTDKISDWQEDELCRRYRTRTVCFGDIDFEFRQDDLAHCDEWINDRWDHQIRIVGVPTNTKAGVEYRWEHTGCSKTGKARTFRTAVRDATTAPYAR